MKALSFYHCVRCMLFAALVIGANSAHAESVKLADGPLGTEALVPPNIWMTVDDSSSMLRSYNPDNIPRVLPASGAILRDEYNGVHRACWTASASEPRTYTMGFCVPYDETTMSNAPNSNPGAPDSGWSGVNQLESLFHNGHPPLLASAFNGQAYNPLIEYRPPKKADGSFLRDMTAASTGNWSTVQWQDGATWYGRPLFNFRTARYAYTPAQRDALFNKYMAGADQAVRNLFDSYITGTGSSARYNLPPHYFKTSVKWCNALRADGSANPGALPNFSNCQDEHIEPGASSPAAQRFIYPYYYALFGEHTGQTDNTSSPAFELVVLDFVNERVNGQSSITHHFFNEETGEMDSFTRSFAQEAQNFANWAAYYKNRLAATKTAASHAFADIDSDASVVPRVGFSSINRLTAGSTLVAASSYRNVAVATLEVAPFTGTQRTNFFDRLLDFRYTWGGTPLQVAMIEVGKKFQKTDAGAPIIHSCQRNYHIMFTDGMWNSPPTANPVGNEDNAVPSGLSGISVYGNTLGSSGHWPDPIRDHRGVSGTLADIALHYWRTDLRPTLDNDVTRTNKDPATWQHLNFSGMGYGVRGVLPSRNQAATLAKMGDGANNTYAWAAPMDSSPHPDRVENVDDVWHASVNGLGRYVAAASPDEFRAGLRAILAEILNLGGARSGVGFTHPNLTSGTQYTYSPSFEPGWKGEVVKKSIDSNGMEHPINEQKTASQNIADMLTPTTNVPEPWRTRRQIFTTVWSGGRVGDGVATPAPFQATGDFGSSAQILHLGNTPARRANVVAYLRGDRSREGEAMGQFRLRGEGPLGDIVNAKPVVVTTPFCDEDKREPEGFRCSYDEEKNPGYRQFYEDNKIRKTMVYVASNDGMLHAFDENLNEKWAYMPSDLFRPQEEIGIINLTFQETNFNTPFKHYFYVDAAPRWLDVYFEDAGKWRTLLVGGLGKGGTSYYALDVTEAGALEDEAATANNKMLWEFTDENMGYTFGRAILAKTRAAAWGYKSDDEPDGRWMAILPSGYNNGSGPGQPKNGDGKGYVFFVDVETGVLMHKMETPEGDPGNPLGLVAINSYVESSTHQLVTAVYGGDQKGNLWRFNLEDDDFEKWTVEKMAVLKDRSGNPQWVTTEPWTVRQKETGDRWLFVGTGGFRHNDDLNSDVEHTFYAFREGGADDTVEDKDKAKAGTFTGRDPRSSGNTCGGGSDPCGLERLTGTWTDVPVSDKLKANGWYEDMDSKYHVNINSMALYGKVIYAANKYVGGLSLGEGNLIGGDPCTSAAFEGRVFARDIFTGATVIKGCAHYRSVSKGVSDIELVQRYRPDGKGKEIVVAIAGLESGLLPDMVEFEEADGDVRIGVPTRLNVRFLE